MRSTSIQSLSQLAIVILTASTCAPVWSQQAAPKFEVATVKQRVSGTPYHFYDCKGDRFQFSGPVFGNLLQWAFSGPREIASRVNIAMEGYEIQAKAPGPIESESQCRLMVQALLADRFKLRFHWEEKEDEVSDLVVARGGPKMQTALPSDQGTDINIVVDGMPWTPRALEERAALNIRGMTMEELAARLDTRGPAIRDKTGLEGRYKIDLRYSWSAPDRPNADPPLEVALAQLGLRLEKHKGVIKVPVLDHVEPPDEN